MYLLVAGAAARPGGLVAPPAQPVPPGSRRVRAPC